MCDLCLIVEFLSLSDIAVDFDLPKPKILLKDIYENKPASL